MNKKPHFANVISSYAVLREHLAIYDGIAARIGDVEVLHELARDEGDESQEPEIETQLAESRERLAHHRILTLWRQRLAAGEERETLAAGLGAAPWDELGQALALSNDVAPRDGRPAGEPTELALYHAAAAAGLDKATMEAALPRLAELPFDSQRKLMTTLHRDGEGVLALVKGAPEVILRRCAYIANGEQRAITDADVETLARVVEETGSAGPSEVAVAAEPGGASASIDVDIDDEAYADLVRRLQRHVVAGELDADAPEDPRVVVHVGSTVEPGVALTFRLVTGVGGSLAVDDHSTPVLHRPLAPGLVGGEDDGLGLRRRTVLTVGGVGHEAGSSADHQVCPSDALSHLGPA